MGFLKNRVRVNTMITRNELKTKNPKKMTKNVLKQKFIQLINQLQSAFTIYFIILYSKWNVNSDPIFPKFSNLITLFAEFSTPIKIANTNLPRFSRIGVQKLICKRGFLPFQIVLILQYQVRALLGNKVPSYPHLLRRTIPSPHICMHGQKEADIVHI